MFAQAANTTIDGVDAGTVDDESVTIAAAAVDVEFEWLFAPIIDADVECLAEDVAVVTDTSVHAGTLRVTSVAITDVMVVDSDSL